MITYIVFRGDNYEEWHVIICLSLMERRKYRSIELTIKKLIDEKGVRDWQCLQAMIVQ